ncbi:hypothetical protein F8388_022271 [Cannabis sativa]|uniref:Uncharacterized protein n=1 Tax=Cannabis sativa TaxID=3483 RepID=A0A7J6F6B2_CANSA|nr:hypothetical protein F8388_022271 [Cannabis sativa]KAF4366237.1 hypothetical protein G4B88_030415 [Cannabis sativa]
MSIRCNQSVCLGRRFYKRAIFCYSPRAILMRSDVGVACQMWGLGVMLIAL